MKNSKQTNFTLDNGAMTLASYPHARRAGDLLFLSGTSSRRHDNSHAGVEILDDGTLVKDIKAQTYAVIENMRSILHLAGLDLCDLVDMSCFLVSMKDYEGFNEVYNTYFENESGPSRTTVGVAELPHPNLLVEIKGIALFPKLEDQ